MKKKLKKNGMGRAGSMVCVLFWCVFSLPLSLCIFPCMASRGTAPPTPWPPQTRGPRPAPSLAPVFLSVSLSLSLSLNERPSLPPLCSQKLGEAKGAHLALLSWRHCPPPPPSASVSLSLSLSIPLSISLSPSLLFVLKAPGRQRAPTSSHFLGGMPPPAHPHPCLPMGPPASPIVFLCLSNQGPASSPPLPPPSLCACPGLSWNPPHPHLVASSSLPHPTTLPTPLSPFSEVGRQKALTSHPFLEGMPTPPFHIPQPCTPMHQLYFLSNHVKLRAFVCTLSTVRPSYHPFSSVLDVPPPFPPLPSPSPSNIDSHSGHFTSQLLQKTTPQPSKATPATLLIMQVSRNMLAVMAVLGASMVRVLPPNALAMSASCSGHAYSPTLSFLFPPTP